MRGKSKKTKEIRDFILANVSQNPAQIGQLAAQRFGVSRQSISRHLNELIKEGLLSSTGTTRNKKFRLNDYIHEEFRYETEATLEEDVVWREEIRPLLNDLPDNVLTIIDYGFTEMFNNVIDHSESTNVHVAVSRNAARIEVVVADNGVGIFNKIQREFNLHDPRHSLLELAKGKLTTDQSRHTGEGIFFTSRAFDRFGLWSGTLCFTRINQNDDWLIETEDRKNVTGTVVFMDISTTSDRTLQSVFNEFASEQENYGFTKTHVPLELLRYEGEKLLSRSQAKRLLARVDQFKEVILDFKGIVTIGQAFADEIFRVFVKEHPETMVYAIHTTPEIDQMINRAMTVKVD